MASNMNLDDYKSIALNRQHDLIKWIENKIEQSMVIRDEAQAEIARLEQQLKTENEFLVSIKNVGTEVNK